MVRQARDRGGRELVLMTWGLIPWFSKDGKPPPPLSAHEQGLRTAASYDCADCQRDFFFVGHRGDAMARFNKSIQPRPCRHDHRAVYLHGHWSQPYLLPYLFRRGHTVHLVDSASCPTES